MTDVGRRLGEVCTAVVTDDDALDEAARDWWPLALAWAAAGRAGPWKAWRPSAVARPSSADEVAAVLAVCDSARVPVTAMAGRSGVCGASVPVFGGVALDMRGLAGIADVDDTSLLVRVRPGTFGEPLEDELRRAHSLTLGHWPQSIAISTVGGWIACRGAGQYSTRYGKIEEMVVGLEVALADGSLARTGGRAPRAAVGPDLTQLFVGSEGTLGVITEAVLRVHPAPDSERRAAYGFASFADGLEACRRIVRRGATPAVLRLYDPAESERNFGIGDGTCVLIVLDEGDAPIIDAAMGVVEEECEMPLDPALVGRWLEHRNDVSALPALVERGYLLDTIEVAARWSVLPSVYAEAIASLQAIEGMVAASAHQSHSYTDGACLYFTWALGPGAADPDAVYVRAWDAVTDVVDRCGGAISHHHGVGLNRARYMRRALGEVAFEILVGLKAALDPNGILNPGKLGLPSPWGEPGWPVTLPSRTPA